MILRQWCHHGECIHSFYYLPFIPPFLNLFIIQYFCMKTMWMHVHQCLCVARSKGIVCPLSKVGVAKIYFHLSFWQKKIEKAEIWAWKQKKCKMFSKSRDLRLHMHAYKPNDFSPLFFIFFACQIRSTPYTSEYTAISLQLFIIFLCM